MKVGVGIAKEKMVENTRDREEGMCKGPVRIERNPKKSSETGVQKEEVSTEQDKTSVKKDSWTSLLRHIQHLGETIQKKFGNIAHSCALIFRVVSVF